MPEFETHRVVKTEVVKLKGDTYAVIFTYDDGTEETAGVGSKDTAEFYAKVQKGETFPIGIHPLLLNAEKAEKLRGKGWDSAAAAVRYCCSPSQADGSVVPIRKAS